MDAGRRVTFGDFSLDLANERLWYRDEVAALTPKAFAVLRRLVEDGGQLVSKEELLRAGWGKTHVSEGVLKVIILEIRRALGDDSAAPSFIETVPRRGYRFIGPRARQAKAPATGDPRAVVGRERVLAQLDRPAREHPRRPAPARVPLRRGRHRQDDGARRLSDPRCLRAGIVDCPRRVPRALRGGRGVSAGARGVRAAAARARRRASDPRVSRHTPPRGWCSSRGSSENRCAGSYSESPRSGCSARWRKRSRRCPP